MASRPRSAWGILGFSLLAGGQVLAADASRCVTIGDPAARLACYDAALMPAPRAAASPAAAVGAAPAMESKPPATFGLAPKADKAAALKVSLKATVVRVQLPASGQIITLDNDQVWQILEYQRHPFVSVHDAVVIDPASLGSFLMSPVSGGAAVRVKRLR